MKSPIDVRDVVVFGGVGMLGYGLWLFRPWISLSVCGAVLVLIGFIPSGRVGPK